MSLSLCPLLSVFFYFEVSPHFSHPNGLERNQNGPWRFNHYDSSVMVLKEVNSKTLSTVYVSDGLESSQFCSYTQWS